ncbi:hypothetical protein PF005_g3091 [Phytophthora fragariae]|uniref:Uncharacterized protein n=1 Tax=Phytophthora fragariae TaxID=53985 RepID=A0A6A4EQ85_9STRA|nr:hypothetical protein PF003_g7191 [Phytophthora fragariae]KAE8945797.1 hypothetical protein PF009_g4551 [Phytophthora fragariae]KAE9131242.1 hypothetical protein PF007_g4199 [Phytophthora fragariae]KAE9150451.1 hypothetical protein PF006_g5159 [Phytophthora fragariae]KAE9231400.1 hypothetical protein PF005_g3091 [Phytophthora fragariae]
MVLGVVFFLMELFRATSIINYMPYPVIAGLISGIKAQLMKNGVHMVSDKALTGAFVTSEVQMLVLRALAFASFAILGQYLKFPVVISLFAMSLGGGGPSHCDDTWGKHGEAEKRWLRWQASKDYEGSHGGKYGHYGKHGYYSNHVSGSVGAPCSPGKYSDNEYSHSYDNDDGKYPSNHLRGSKYDGSKSNTGAYQRKPEYEDSHGSKGYPAQGQYQVKGSDSSAGSNDDCDKNTSIESSHAPPYSVSSHQEDFYAQTTTEPAYSIPAQKEGSCAQVTTEPPYSTPGLLRTAPPYSTPAQQQSSYVQTTTEPPYSTPAQQQSSYVQTTTEPAYSD